MPYGYLAETGLNPNFGALVGSEEVNDSTFGFSVWETLIQVGDARGTHFDILFNGELIEADESGELERWEKRKFEDEDLIIVRKQSSPKKCDPVL